MPITGVMQRWKGKVKGHVGLFGNGGVVINPVTALVAVGTNRATALLLSAALNFIATAAASTGAQLPPGFYPGQTCDIYNDGANPIKVYAAGSDTIDGTAGATGVTLTNALRCRYTVKSISNGVCTWVSAQLGAVSA